MHGQNYLVPLGNTQHLLGHNAAGYSLTKVLHNLSPVHIHRKSLGLVRPLLLLFTLQGLRNHPLEVGVLDEQPIGKAKPFVGNCVDDTRYVDLHRLPQCQRLESVACRLPQHRDTEIGCPVCVDDTLSFL